MSEVVGKTGRKYGSTDLLFPEELADAVRRGRGYVFAMKRAGFPMPGGTATVEEYRAWHLRHPNFKTSGYYGKTGKQPRVTELSVDFS